MDREEYREKLDQLTDAVSDKDYKKALSIAEQIDWRRVKSLNTLNMVADVYEVNKKYEAEKRILLLAYEKASIGRSILYRLVEVCLKLNQIGEAEKYFREYSKIAKNDSSRCILQYRLYKATRAPLEAQINVLEEYRDKEFTERWAYELAALYAKAGDKKRCVETCDDLILWFGDGKYVLKAMRLKMRYEQLTPSQEKNYKRMMAMGGYESEPRERDRIEADAEDRAGARLYHEAGLTSSGREKAPAGAASAADRAEAANVDHAAANAEYAEAETDATRADVTMDQTPQNILQSENNEVEPSDTVNETASEQPDQTPETAAADEDDKVSEGGFRARFSKTINNIFGTADDSSDDMFGDIDADYTSVEDSGQAEGPEEKEETEGLRLRELKDDLPQPADAELSDAAPENDTEDAVDTENAEDDTADAVDTENAEDDTADAVYTENAEDDTADAVDTENAEIDTADAETADQDNAAGTENATEMTDMKETEDADMTENAAGMTGTGSTVSGQPDGAEEISADAAKAKEEPGVAKSAADALQGLKEGMEAEKAQSEKADSEPPATEDDTDMKVIPEKTQKKPHYIEELEVPDPEPTPEEKKRHTHTISLDTIGENTIPVSIDKILSEETPEERRIRILNKEKPTRMSEEQRKIFTYFARVPGMDGQILEAVNSVYMHAGERTSMHGNIAVMGARGCGKSRLAHGLIVAMCRDLGLEACKMARITGKNLNKKDAAKVVSVMAGGFLIIEDISNVTEATLNTLNQAMEFRTDRLVVIIEDEKTRMRAFLKAHPQFAAKFDKVISIPVFTNDELVTFARTYSTENGCKIDDLAVLALYTIIGNMQSEEEPATISDVKEIIDGAILHATKGRRRHGNLDAEKTGKWIILHEKDLTASS